MTGANRPSAKLEQLTTWTCSRSWGTLPVPRKPKSINKSINNMAITGRRDDFYLRSLHGRRRHASRGTGPLTAHDLAAHWARQRSTVRTARRRESTGAAGWLYPTFPPDTCLEPLKHERFGCRTARLALMTRTRQIRRLDQICARGSGAGRARWDATGVLRTTCTYYIAPRYLHRHPATLCTWVVQGTRCIYPWMPWYLGSSAL